MSGQGAGLRLACASGMELGAYALVCAFGLLVILLLMLELGHRAGGRQRARLLEGGSSGFSAVEAAVFALLGLLVAFSFQGAYARFDARRTLITTEANAIGTAWLRLDLLPAESQPAIRDLFRRYLDSRLKTYQVLDEQVAALSEVQNSIRLQGQIWTQAVAAARQSPNPAAVSLLVPALNDMFDIVTERLVATRSHPPALVFAMLVLLACASAFFAGHGMSGSRIRSWFHSFGYALILSLVVFVILDLEYPRQGLIRIDQFDELLLLQRQAMQ